jgi:hypothetical protein
LEASYTRGGGAVGCRRALTAARVYERVKRAYIRWGSERKKPRALRGARGRKRHLRTTNFSYKLPRARAAAYDANNGKAFFYGSRRAFLRRALINKSVRALVTPAALFFF